MRADRRVDRAVTAELAFPGGRQASIWSHRLLSITARVQGRHGTLSVTNFLVPHLFHRLRVRTADGSRTERVPGESTRTGSWG